MNLIHIKTDRAHGEIPLIISNLKSIVGWKVWDDRVKALISQTRANPLWPDFIQDRHGLELAFHDIMHHYRFRGKYPWAQSAKEQDFYSFATLFTEVYKRLGPQGQGRLRGMLQSGLEKECGLGPIAYEMQVAAHLMSRGFAVFFHDLECGGGFDFLATSGTTSVEIECKYISTDLGRKLHRRRVYDLGGILYPIMNRHTDEGMLVRVTIGDRLTSQAPQQCLIRDRVYSVLLDGQKSCGDDECFVTAEPFTIRDSPFSGDTMSLRRTSVDNEVRKFFDIKNEHTLLHWRPNVSAVVVSLKSAKQDRLLPEMVKKLKADTKAQFTGTKPAFLLLHLDDISDEQLSELHRMELGGERTGICLAIEYLLRS